MNRREFLTGASAVAVAAAVPVGAVEAAAKSAFFTVSRPAAPLLTVTTRCGTMVSTHFLDAAAARVREMQARGIDWDMVEQAYFVCDATNEAEARVNVKEILPSVR